MLTLNARTALAVLGSAWIARTGSSADVHPRLLRGSDGRYRCPILTAGLSLPEALGLTLVTDWAELAEHDHLVRRHPGGEYFWSLRLGGLVIERLTAAEAQPLTRALITCREIVWPRAPGRLWPRRDMVRQALELHARCMEVILRGPIAADGKPVFAQEARC